MKWIDDFLNNITMYRLVLYFLIILAVIGLVYCFTGTLSYDPVAYVFSFTLILAVCYIANFIFAKAFETPVNIESYWISGLILGLIIKPPTNLTGIIFVGWAALLTIALKFIFTFNKKHIFNPVAISVAITALAISGSANWWVGSLAMLPFVAVGGFLVVRKIRRWDLVLSFLGASLFAIFISGLITGSDPLTKVIRSITDTPLIFFASIMITEPLTSPPTKLLRIIYGAIVGILFVPQIHVGSLYSTPELALIAGNIYSFIVSPKLKLILTLKSKVQLTPDTYDFVFNLAKPIKFTPGQYMEFTFEHPNTDARGNRRYLSLASSPTEQEIRLGIKFGNPPSSYKKNLLLMNPGDKIAAGQLIGDFTLPKDPAKKLVLIAGGIGITPYRSILKYLIDKGERRDIIVVYSASGGDGFVYTDILNQAHEKLGIRTIIVDTKTVGRMDANKLLKEIPDYQNRTFYISGSHNVVTAFEDIVNSLKVPKNQIITDYFPGFA